LLYIKFFRELLLGLNAMNDESSSKKSKKTVRFSDQVVETDDLDNTQVLQLQQRIIQSNFIYYLLSEIIYYQKLINNRLKIRPR